VSKCPLPYHLSTLIGNAMGQVNNITNQFENSVLVTLFFGKPDEASNYGAGFVVRFAVPPCVGDLLDIEQNSIKKLPHEDLHHCYWEIVHVAHDLILEYDEDLEGPAIPVATLKAIAHPRI